jgi:hypothetical protein
VPVLDAEARSSSAGDIGISRATTQAVSNAAHENFLFTNTRSA